MDLVNRTVFAISTVSTSVVGVAARLTKDWNFQAEAFRNSLVSDLNPESTFLLGNLGIGVSRTLSALNQWSVYFRLTRQIHWGGGLPPEGWSGTRPSRLRWWVWWRELCKSGRWRAFARRRKCRSVWMNREQWLRRRTGDTGSPMSPKVRTRSGWRWTSCPRSTIRGGGADAGGGRAAANQPGRV